MNPDEIAELQNLTVDEIKDRVDQLDAEGLAELRRLETADGAEDGRKGVITAIDDAEAALALALAPAPAAPPAKPSARAAAAKPAEQRAAWQAADYDGPLTIDQANWRNEHVKPVREARTK